ncbi:MAG: hypothetical protein P8N40_09190 [Gammaproteobacteria bacterium]|nr:hypothetical protein [Gammaproteobacteria bacterium]
MKRTSGLKLCFLIAALFVPLIDAPIVSAGEEQRAPPEARTSGTLGPAVMRAISQIQEMMQPEDEEDEPDMEGAKAELDELYERRFERMNDFEKQTILNFYTNYWLTLENYPEAISTFEQILEIEDVREDTRLRTLRSLGQLTAAEERWRDSIRYYELWREVSLEEDEIVYRGLSYAHYQVDELAEALPHWIAYMEVLLDRGEVVERDDYSYLNGLYFQLEDFESALPLTKTMVVLFDDQRDWMNLSAVYASLDDEDRRVRSMNVAYLKGMLEDENRFLNLGQSLGGIDVPYSGAKILIDGIDQQIIEQNEDNLTTLSQMYLIASDYEAALEPALSVAELSDSGDGFDTYGYIHYVLTNYREAADAFQMAIDKGDLSRRADTLLFLSRSLIELDDFDGAIDSARESAEAGNEAEQRSANDYIRFIESTRDRFNIIAERREDAIDFYEPYPSLID